MPLVFTGQTAPYIGGTSLRAKDARSGKQVVVKATDEVLKDHGLGTVQSVASRKYDAGQIEPDGTVSVRTSDF